VLLNAVVNTIGIGFQCGAHANWQFVNNSDCGSPILINLGSEDAG
jgi:hypothetical protein